jgi:phospholipid/cholesterol/gamma-HCH transport system substrate-binding protein
MVIGLFTLAVVAGVFGFVYWFQNIGGTGERAYYGVVFDGSVSGLRTGATVLFNGIRVGEVTNLKLNPQHPKQVIAVISIEKSVAVRRDTEVGLEFQGLTGIASLSLKGGDPASPALAGSKDNPPLLAAAPGSAQDVTQGARDTMRRVDQLIEQNQEAFHNALANLDKFSQALARNSERIDRITEGLQPAGRTARAASSTKRYVRSSRSPPVWTSVLTRSLKASISSPPPAPGNSTRSAPTRTA